jgi:hypothetical protein
VSDVPLMANSVTPAEEIYRKQLMKVSAELDAALAWIRVVGEETESGGDRNMTLAKIRYLLRLLPYSDHTYHCGVKSGEKCDCGFNAVLQPNKSISCRS